MSVEKTKVTRSRHQFQGHACENCMGGNSSSGMYWYSLPAHFVQGIFLELFTDLMVEP